MGVLIWSQWAKLIALTAGFFEVIGGIFGIFYRISMLHPLTNIFDPIFNPVNIVSIICIPLGVLVVAIEYPFSPFKDTVLTTQFIPRVILYLLISAFSVLDYQNVNPGLYLLIAATMYMAAIMKGEEHNLRTQAKQKGMRKKMVV
ncbi:hypothetical protein Glove_103g54 [Diversispora epigaea]|uniref:DUF7727 domain-containing protein n=1 Tax=Diversispora epigaea TaxID=1348612 RepID=A0A397JA34_9GLOM|nr:hypothetical protein Glove_103g54 [Diversispora epigaea]